MAYQVLARKYRPQRFADVVGQDHVTVTLANALAQDRIAHGYIFSGHRGIGKTTIARILAMSLNCRNPIGSPARPTLEPCQLCELGAFAGPFGSIGRAALCAHALAAINSTGKKKALVNMPANLHPHQARFNEEVMENQ